MACRKAADRAMAELSGWMERQREEQDAARRELVQQQRKHWTPAAVFERCCAPWLAGGGGCCGGGCGLDHPRVLLDWKDGQAVATLSHALDPFLNYFDQLCDQGLASKRDTGGEDRLSYNLVGFLQSHVERLESHDGIGNHLFKVRSADARSASRRAHERHAAEEDLRSEAKRRKLQGPAATDELLDRVLAVCHNHSLEHHLDVAEIAWMRLACRTMARYAARMAASRMKQLRLTCSVLTDGMWRVVRRRSDVPDGQEEGCLRVIQAEGRGGHVLADALPFGGGGGTGFPPLNYNNPIHLYRVAASRVPLSLTQGLAAFAPPPNAEDVPFESDFLYHGGAIPNNTGNYQGHLVRVYLEAAAVPAAADDGGGGETNKTKKDKLPEQDLLFSEQLEVARCSIVPAFPPVGVPTTTSNGITYEFTASEVEDREILPDSTVRGRTLRYRGRLRIREVRFGFADLLGAYVRKKLPVARRHLQQEIKARRPATRLETEYVRALARAAREAPGGSSAFEGMRGW